MNDLEKNKAIYDAMVKIANEVFENAVSKSERLQKRLKDNGGRILLNELTKAKSFVYQLIKESTDYAIRTVSVETFTCSFHAARVFELLKQFKTLSKTKGDVYFEFVEKNERKYVGRLEIDFENAASAKLLANSTLKDVMCPSLAYVCVEVNATRGITSFVSTDRREINVVSNFKKECLIKNGENDSVYLGLFAAADWKRICDYQKKNKTPLCFDVYRREDGELQDSMEVRIGDSVVKSFVVDARFPNWRKPMKSFESMVHIKLQESDVKDAQKWLARIKADNENDSVGISVYEGDTLVYLDTEHGTTEFGIQRPSETAAFRLQHPAKATLKTALSIKRLQKKRFSGFWVSTKSGGGVYVDDENCDLCFLMPVFADVPDRTKEKAATA